MGGSGVEQGRAGESQEVHAENKDRAVESSQIGSRINAMCEPRSLTTNARGAVVGAAAVPGAGDEDGGADHPPVDTGQEEQDHGKAGREVRGLDGVLCL